MVGRSHSKAGRPEALVGRRRTDADAAGQPEAQASKETAAARAKAAATEPKAGNAERARSHTFRVH